VLTELAHARPFYSRSHNLAISPFLPPFYLLAALGFVVVRKQRLAWLLAGIIAGHVAVIGLTFADWDGRFLRHFLPLVGVLFARGLLHAIDPHRLRATAVRRRSFLVSPDQASGAALF
jgi:hypothetical protein